MSATNGGEKGRVDSRDKAWEVIDPWILVGQNEFIKILQVKYLGILNDFRVHYRRKLVFIYRA